MSSLKKNIGYNFAYQLLVLALPLVTAPYLARVIGAEGIGVYSYSYAIATYFVYFVKLGLDNYGNRTIAACRSDRKLRTERFWSIYAMQLCCFVAFGSCYVAYALFLSDNQAIALLQGIYVLSSLFDVNWFFFGMEQFKLTVIRNTIVKVITTALVFLLVRDAGDVGVYVGVMAGGMLASQMVLWPFLCRFIGFHKPRLQEVAAHIKPNLVLFISVIAISVYNVLSKVILGYVAGPEEVGFFESAAKIVAVPVALIGAVGTVMLPRTSALLAEGKEDAAAAHTDKTMLVVMAFSGVAAFGMPAIAHPFTEIFYGPGFERSAEALVVLSATVPLLGFGNVMRTQYLIPRAMDSVFLVSAICGAVASLTVNLLLAPVMGAVGAAFASVAAETAVLAYQCLRVRRGFPLGRYFAYALVFIGAGAVMAFLLSFVPQAESAMVQIAIKVSVGLVIYSILTLPVFRIVARRKLTAKNASVAKERDE